MKNPQGTDWPDIQVTGEVLSQTAARLPDKVGLICEGLHMTFAEMDAGANQLANGLLDLGLARGAKVAIMARNVPAYALIFFGAARSGHVLVHASTRYIADELAYVLQKSDSEALIVEAPFADIARAAVDNCPGIRHLIVIDDILQETQTPVDASRFSDLLSSASPLPPDVVVAGSDIFGITFTGGTTGFPKGVVNRAKTDRVQGMVNMAGMLVKPDDVFYTALPLFHANALVITASLAMAGGVPFGLDKKFSASRFWENTRRYGATQFNGIGAMIPILMKQPERPDDRDNSVRAVISAACPINLWEAFEKRFGLQIWEIYGAVDGGGVMTLNMGNAPAGSIGKPLRGEWKLVDENDEEVPAGEIGEMINKVDEGSIRTAEYYKNDEASAKKSQGGWIRSGDLFYADKDKNLYFVDRASDSMRRRGENISSFEVERIVEKYPDVMTCAAFGVPSELGEDEVMLWVKPVAGKTLDLKELIRHCVDNMAFFMIPRYIDMVEDIPRTGTLRSQKAGMKKQGVTDRTWDREKEMPDLKKR